MVTPVTNGLPDRFTVSPTMKCDKKLTLFSKNENQPAEYVTLINPNNTGKKHS
ncbi:hypothetical protein [Escherichia coli ISC7]|uniref:Uncharacterized protein n=1 Tax=Escherichia coli ISC7 TaxID=1432555 RepID=W1ESG1_ECOLX|nr:hypothetical protein [Escherichia coli ISC7]